MKATDDLTLEVNGALKDMRVRKALSYAVDHDVIINNILQGTYGEFDAGRHNLRCYCRLCRRMDRRIDAAPR